jgi:hypothetical protein
MMLFNKAFYRLDLFIFQGGEEKKEMLLFIYSNLMLSVDEKRPLMILSERL